MRTTISKTFDFDAAHSLPFLPADHKCHRLHGHTYRVEITLTGEPDENGMLLDYAEIAEAWAPLHELLDHRCLNDIEVTAPDGTVFVGINGVKGLGTSTTENVAAFIMNRLLGLPGLDRVRVYESATTYGEVSTPR